MRTYKKKQYTSTVEALEKMTCDLCGREAPGGKWIDGVYEDKEVKVSFKTGHSYPDGGYYTKFSVDICPGCFMDKVRPWLESQGAVMRKEEIDF